MAKPKTRTFTKTIDGREYVQVAHTPSDAVVLTFNGWREQREPAPAAEPATRTPAKKTAARATAQPADKPSK
jgi:hypothetical protein